MNVFNHVPKTAGTSLRSFFDCEYGPHRMAHFYGSFGTPIGKFMQSLSTNTIELIFGHINCDFENFLAGIPKVQNYYSLVRDPYTHIASYYFHCQRSPDFAGPDRQKRANEIGLGEWLTDPMRPTNTQYQMLSLGRSNRFQSVDDVFNHYQFIGLHENLPQSIMVFSDLLGFKCGKLPCHNVGSNKQSDVYSNSKWRELTMTTDCLDWEIYEKARCRFMERFTLGSVDKNGSHFI